MARLTEIDGFNAANAAQLAALGITTTNALLAAGAAYADRTALAEQSGIGEFALMAIIGRADLERIRGIGWDYAGLVAGVGVPDVLALAHQDVSKLWAELKSHNDANQLVRRPPTEAQVRDWVAEAQQLPILITYRPAEVY